MKNINPFFLATGLVFLVCGYAWAGGSIEFLGNFSGGTVGAPTVFTGDNASGTGTLRIRPSDEDTQLVLCEASNNAATEVCSSWSHYNASATVSGYAITANGYYNTSSLQQRYNTAFGISQVNAQSGTSATDNFVSLNVFGTGGAVAGNASLVATGAATSTFYTGTLGTVTNDFRGPITNGGSATCNGQNSGFLCATDNLAISGSSSTLMIHETDATSYSSNQYMNSAGTVVANVGHYGASFADADYADKIVMVGVSKTVGLMRTDDVAAGTTVVEVRDNAAGTGVKLVDIDGAGNIKLDSGATRSRGTITLAAGTGTATVTSGAICVCTDTTANASVKCAVSATTLTATGTGTDVIAYHCL